MSFNTENRKINDIFQRSCRYIVPRYQREYVWKKNNWSELINDVKFTLQNGNSLNWSHFLGTIVLSDLTEQNGKTAHVGIKDYEIVDGQQRLTTIYILLNCICYSFNKIGNEQAKKRGNYVYNTFLISLDGDSCPVLTILNEDTNQDLIEIVQNVKDLEFPKKSNFYYNLFDYFYSQLKNYTFDELDLFLQKLLAINIVEITSDQEEEIYNIFEVLNARGQKLKQMELLKNHIMKYIQPRTEDIVDKAKEKWKKIIDNSNHLSDVDVLLNHFCKCYIKKQADNNESIYKLIKEEIEINNLSTFLDDFLSYSSCYRIITQKNNKDKYIQYFDIKKNKQIRGLLSVIQYLRNRDIISEEVKRISFKNLRNYFFIFNLFSYTSNKTDSIVSKYSYELFRVKSEVDYKFLSTRLFEDLNDLIKDDSANIYKTFDSNHMYKFSNKNRNYKKNNKLVKYILYCLLERQQIDSDIHQENLTIEHIVPDDGTSETSSLSNLTLTSELINSEMLKDKPISVKLEILKEKSSIIENRNLIKYFNDGVFDFEKRKKDMYELIFEEEFNFDLECYHLNKEDVDLYYIQKSKLSGNEYLMNILELKGKNMVAYLENSPKEKDYWNQYKKLMEKK